MFASAICCGCKDVGVTKAMPSYPATTIVHLTLCLLGVSASCALHTYVAFVGCSCHHSTGLGRCHVSFAPYCGCKGLGCGFGASASCILHMYVVCCSCLSSPLCFNHVHPCSRRASKLTGGGSLGFAQVLL
jgi:hypothetical protein